MSSWKEHRIKQMKDLALNISANRSREEDVIAILLFGSVVKGNIHSESDVDVVIIKDTQENLIKRNESLIEGIRIDLWEHSCSFYDSLFRKDWQPTEMFFYSLFLNIIQECEVLYDKESKFVDFRKKAIEWNWSEPCKDFIKDKICRALSNYEEEDYDKFEKLVYLRKIFLLKLCMKLLSIGKPVSIRNKDYYLKCKQYFSIREFETIFGRTPNIKELKQLIETTMNLFYREVKSREPWTELKDAQKHLSNKQGFMATISLQNGAFYLGGVGLSNRGIKRENKDFLYPESETELIEKSKEHWKEFYNMYRKVHNAEDWRNEEVDYAYSQLRAPAS